MVRLTPCALVLAVSSVELVAGFSPLSTDAIRASNTALSLSKDGQGNGKKVIATALASAYLLAGLFSVDAAIAAPDNDVTGFGGTSTVLAAKSGGRAGGRSSSASMSRSSPSMSRSSPSMSRSSPPPASRQTTVIKNTYIQQPSYVAPSVIYAAPAPMMGGPSLGLVAGLAAVDAIGDGMRENRQNNEIRAARSELQASKQKEFEMEMRMKQLEQGQMTMQINQQVQQQVQMQTLKP